MQHPLEKKVAAVGRRVRMLLVVYALFRVLAIGLAVAAAVALCDYFIHFEDRGIRFIGSLLAAAAVTWAIARYLVEALLTRLGDVHVALRIERRFPELADRLASTIEFLKQPEDDPQAGSASLRRAVINQTTSELEQFDLREVVRKMPAARSLMAAAVVCLGVGVLFALDPGSVRIAALRLTNPWSDARWPQKNHLLFRDPVRRVALGQPFEVELIDALGAPLPSKVSILYRTVTPGEKPQVETKAMQYVASVMVARREHITRPFAYRAVGGDDDSMRWIEVEVVEPPLVEEMAVRLDYPSYTRWPSETSERHIRALVGTTVHITATTTKRLRSATLHLEDGREIQARVREDQFGFELPGEGTEPFVIDRSGAYWFALEGVEGLVGGTDVRYEIRALADLPPSVTIEEPLANVFVTADAVVPIKITAKDDLALRDVALHYLRSDRSEQGEIVELLYTGPPQVAPPAAEARTFEGQTLPVEHLWELAALGLEPGLQITFHATASDYLPQVGQSPARRLLIITPEELEGRMDQRQSLILSELARVLKMQQESRTGTTAVEIQLNEVGHLAKHDLDQLQGAELTQRQVDRTLRGTGESIQGHIQSLLVDLTNNKVKSPDIERRMTALSLEIERLAQEHLPVIRRELTAAVKRGQQRLDDAAAGDPAPADAEPDEVLRRSLATAGENQDAVIATLEALLSNLSQWNEYRRLHRELATLEREQQELTQKTSEAGRDTLSQQIDELSPQQRADLKKLAQRQQELARQFESLTGRMEQMEGAVRAEDPQAAATMADALDQARRQAISGQMREAGDRINQNRMGQAVPGQQQIARDLKEMLDILANRHEHELELLVKKLREAERELADIRRRQEGLRKRMEEAAAQADSQERKRELQRLVREQRELQQQADRFARRLQRLQANKAARSTARASSRMGQAGGAAEQGDGDAAAGEGARAERDLDEAQQQLAQRRRQAERDLAMEQLAKIEDSIQSLQTRQQGVIDETARLETLRQKQGRFARAQAVSLRSLARLQKALEGEARTLAEKIKAAQAFELALLGAAGQMQQAAEGLEGRETGETTLAAEKLAHARLTLLLEALKPDEPKPGKDGGGGAGGGGSGGAAPRDGISDVAQLKLIKLLQETINQRTEDFGESLDRQQPLSPQQQHRLAMLSDEQRQLADLVLDLSRPTTDNPEDDPEQLDKLLPEDLDVDLPEPLIPEEKP